MRTTITIRDDLYERVRRRSFDERRTLGDVMNELIEKGLTQHGTVPARELGRFAGEIIVGEGFDDPLEEIDRALDETIEP